MFEPKVMFEPIDFSNPLIKIIFLIIGIVGLFACVGGLIWIIKDWNNVPEIFRHKVIPYMDDYEKQTKEKKMKKLSFFQVLKSNLKCAFCSEKDCPTRYYPDRKKRLHYEGSRYIIKCKKAK